MAKKILVVDDEPDVVTFFTELLDENGYETMSATDGAEAVETARSFRPDLVTLDVSMPGQSGIRAFRELKGDSNLKDIPVIIVTGVSSDFKRFISTRSQVPAPEGYIEKSVQPEQLLAEVKRLVG